MKRATLSNALAGFCENLGCNLRVGLDANGFGAAMGGNNPGQFQWCHGLISLENVKEHATLSAGAHVERGVDVETTEDHVNKAADRGCCVSSC